MAKRKSKKSPSRRRRVGAVKGGENLTLILGGAVGGIATAMLAAKVAPQMDAKIKGAVAAVAGFLVSKSKMPLLKGVGIGMGISGVNTLVTSVMSPGAVGAIGYGDGMAGFEAYPNSPQLNTIAGFDQYPNSPQANVIAGINPKDATACGVC